MPIRYVIDLTCCRALLAASVFGYHLSLQLGGGGPAARLYLGVDGFFVLSGLVLALAHPDPGLGWPALRAFWGRRLLRIYPVHLATLALMAALALGAAASGAALRDPGRFGLRELALNLLLLHGWGFSGRWAWNYPSWSVSTEWFGYLLFPAAWAAVRRLGPAPAAALAATCLASLHLVQRGGGLGLNLTYEGALWRLLPEFVAGMAAARLAPALARRASGRLLAGAGAVWAAAALVWGSDAAVMPGMWLALAGLLAASLQGAPPSLARLPGLAALGELSYAFYMSFAVIETVQAQAWRRLGLAPADAPAAYVAVASLGTFALAVLLRRFVELPAMRAPRLATRPASV